MISVNTIDSPNAEVIVEGKATTTPKGYGHPFLL